MQADGQDGLDRGQARENGIVPGGPALETRRQVALLEVMAGEAETHRQDRDAARIVEPSLVEVHPLAEALAGRVLKGDAAHMGADAGRLAGDDETHAFGNLENRTRLMRQRRATGALDADTAGPHGVGKHRLALLGALRPHEKTEERRRLERQRSTSSSAGT